MCSDCVGTLAESPFGYYGSRQTTTAGSRQIVYRIQNFDSTTTATVQVAVSIFSKPTGSFGAYFTDLVNATSFPVAPLASGAAATGSVPFTLVAGREYIVDIVATGTSYANEANPQNNYRQFRFIVP